MDRGAWQAKVHGVARVGHGLATKPTNQWTWIGQTLGDGEREEGLVCCSAWGVTKSWT